MRTVSLTLRTALYAEATDDFPVFLVTVTHPDLADPLLFSSDPTNRLSVDPLAYGTVSRTQTYNFLPISFVMPDDSDDTPPAIKLVIDNVNRDLIPLLRSVSTPASISIEMVLASDPDTVEVAWEDFDLVGATYDATSASLDLTINALATEPFPVGTFNPSGFGGLFGAA